MTEAWLAEGPVAAGPLPARGDALSFSMEKEAEGLEILVSEDCELPGGGIVLSPPDAAGYASASVAGRPCERWPGCEVVLRVLPARVLLRR